MIQLDPILIHQLDALDAQLQQLEVRLLAATAATRGGSLIYQYLQRLGQAGVDRLVTSKYGAALIPPRQAESTADLQATWRYQIGTDFIAWANTEGDKIVGEVNKNLIVHFLDEGTVAHAPVMATYMHWIGRKQYSGQAFFKTWVRGITPQYIFIQLQAFIEAMHEAEWVQFMEELFEF